MLTSDTPQAELTELISKTQGDDEVEGIRLMRAGGDVCPQDESQLMTFTLDVWCNDGANRDP